MRGTDGMGLQMNPQYLLNDAVVFLLFGVGFYFLGMEKQQQALNGSPVKRKFQKNQKIA